MVRDIVSDNVGTTLAVVLFAEGVKREKPMKYDPKIHHRRSIRLKGYDYRNAGAYFITICTQNRECLLDDPILNEIINAVWLALPLWFPTIALDVFVIMPNHIHFIVWLRNRIVGATPAVALDPDAVALDPDAVAHSPARTGASPVPTEAGARWVIPDAETVNDSPSLGDVVGTFKSLIFTVYLDWIKINDPSRRAKFWQRNYYERIVRNERVLNAIRQYIIDNPLHWDLDRDNRQNLRQLPAPEKVEDYLEDIKELLPGDDEKS
jgi:putative transposase